MASLPPPSFTISSDIFLIRPLVRGDASPALETWTEDENAAAMLNTTPGTWTVAQQAEYFGEHEGRQQWQVLGIFPKQSKKPIGLFIVKVKPTDGVFTVSHLIGDMAWRGKDMTFRASELVYDYFFNVLGYAKAKARVRPENRPMPWHLYNFAWCKEARLNKHLRLAASKERSDVFVFGLLADGGLGMKHARRKSQSGDQTAGRAVQS